MPTPFDRIFGSALADLQTRGVDFAPEAPWALVRSAFPEAIRQQPGATLDQVMRDARIYLGAEQAPPPQAPPIPEAPSSAVQAGMGTGTVAAPGAGPAGITGYDPSLVGLGLTALGSMPGAPAGIGLGKAALSLAGKMGIGPASNMVDDQNNPVAALYEGIAGRLGLPSGFVSGGRPGAIAALAANPNFVNDPEFMGFAGPFSEAVSGRDTDRSGETGAMGLGAQAAFDAVGRGDSPYGPTPTQGPVPSFQGRTGIGVDEGTPGTPPSTDPTESGVAPDGPGTGQGPAPGSGATGQGGTGTGTGTGDGGPSGATGDGPYHFGGVVRGQGDQSITAKGGEFVMNQTATHAFRPWLDALNTMVPPDPGLDSLLTQARSHLEG